MAGESPGSFFHVPDDAFRRVFRCSPGAAVLRDADGVALAVNAAFEGLFGFRAADVKGFACAPASRPRACSRNARTCAARRPGSG
jgi:Amt family ammonium transporter